MGFHSRHGPCHITQHGAPAGLAGMTTGAVLVEYKFIGRLFCHAHQGQRRLSLFHFLHIAPFIKKAGQMDPLLLQVGSSQNGALFVRCALYLLIVAEGKVNVEIRRKALFQEFLHRIHFRSEHGLTIFGTPSPETAFLHFSPKGRMAPLLLMNSRHHVLMGHEQYRILLRMVRFPVEKKTGLSDSGERQFFKNQRPGLLHVLVKAVKL